MTAIENTPDLWRALIPRPAATDHKYDRGHTAIIGSDQYTGATRLAAEACSRIGSGLVSVISAAPTDLYRKTLPPDIMVSDEDFSSLNRVNTVLAGPGGCSDAQGQLVLGASTQAAMVLDADAIRLWPYLSGRSCVLTPHAGEFERFFGDLKGSLTERAAAASERSQATLILKGPETLIAAPDGLLVRNTHATPYLAKAGTGDVLAGLVAGLVAQGMPSFDAACASVWIHGEAGRQIGPGLVPQDMFSRFAGILTDLTV